MLHKNKKIAISALTPTLKLTQTLTLTLLSNVNQTQNLTQTLTIHDLKDIYKSVNEK